MLPIVAVVGRPNTGKSTLFNKICGRKTSITFDESGTTRDRIFQKIELDDKPVLFVDTGGIEVGKAENDIEADIQKQSMIAIQDADLIVFLVDSKEELTASDFHAAKLLRESRKDVVLVASKVDNEKIEEQVYNLYELGFGDPVKVSAVHNMGVDILLGVIEKKLKAKKLLKRSKETQEVYEGRTVLSFVGKPNVGKSSMVNAILGKEQVIVSDVPGTTRDPISLYFDYEDKRYVLVDTAGIRKSGKLRGEWLEKFSVIRSLKSIEESDISILVFDGSLGLSKQDLRVCEYVLEANKGLIIVLNKADLLKPQEKNRLLGILKSRMPFAYFAPVIFTSALKGRNVLEILAQADQIQLERNKKIKTKDLNYFLERTLASHPAKPGLKFKFVEQVEVNPPTFVFFVNKPDEVHFSYKRYLENAIRAEYGFGGTAIVLIFKGKMPAKATIDKVA